MPFWCQRHHFIDARIDGTDDSFAVDQAKRFSPAQRRAVKSWSQGASQWRRARHQDHRRRLACNSVCTRSTRHYRVAHEMKFTQALAAAVTITVAVPAAFAETYPSKPI